MSLKKIAKKSRSHIEHKIDASHYFHNIDHTEWVVKQCELFINYYNFSDKEAELLLLAAWTHDLGYTQGRSDHEENSFEIVKNWMTEYNYSQAEINKVGQLIRATKVPTKPKGLLSMCICDADLQHLSSKDYDEWTSKLLKEWIATNEFPNDEKLLLEIQIKFLSNHRYYTPYAVNNWSAQKLNNLNILKAKYQELFKANS